MAPHVLVAYVQITLMAMLAHQQVNAFRTFAPLLAFVVIVDVSFRTPSALTLANACMAIVEMACATTRVSAALVIKPQTAIHQQDSNAKTRHARVQLQRPAPWEIRTV